MNKNRSYRLLISTVILFSLFGFTGCNEDCTAKEIETEAHFSYDGETAPEYWGSLSEAWSTCDNGLDFTTVEAGMTHQSPVDFATPSSAMDANFTVDNNYSIPFTISNNGHTIVLTPEANVTDHDTLTINGKIYTLTQFHFHSLSEHTENGSHAAMEAHFVHISEDGSLAVLGAFIDANSTLANSELGKVFVDTLPEEEMTGATVTINIANILPDSKVYSYSGSLTTPPCTEYVAWNVYLDHLYLSEEDIQEFEEQYDHNYRPTTGVLQ